MSNILRRIKREILMLFSIIVAINNRSVRHNHFHSSLAVRDSFIKTFCSGQNSVVVLVMLERIQLFCPFHVRQNFVVLSMLCWTESSCFVHFLLDRTLSCCPCYGGSTSVVLSMLCWTELSLPCYVVSSYQQQIFVLMTR